LEIIVPAYNEQGRIAGTVEALARRLSSLDMTTAVRVIDNGSSDRTAEIVDQVGAENVEVTVVGCSARGKGRVVTRGMLTSSARFVGFCDADLATPVHGLDDALALLEAGWPVVIGSRRCEGARLVSPQKLVRRLGDKAFRLVTRHIVGDVSDSQCDFKFFHGPVARQVFSHVKTAGFAFDLEVIAAARLLGLPVKEFPVAWSDRDGSTFRPGRDGVDVVHEMLRLRQRVQTRPLVGLDA
jgi:dolichyl-phosphate beta-glucosyltransferase